MCRFLPNVINDMDVPRALMHVHHFLKANPAHTWAQRGNDMPLRTVKTIVHTLAKLKGAKVSAGSILVVLIWRFIYVTSFARRIFPFSKIFKATLFDVTAKMLLAALY